MCMTIHQNKAIDNSCTSPGAWSYDAENRRECIFNFLFVSMEGPQSKELRSGCEDHVRFAEAELASQSTEKISALKNVLHASLDDTDFPSRTQYEFALKSVFVTQQYSL